MTGESIAMLALPLLEERIAIISYLSLSLFAILENKMLEQVGPDL